MKEPTKSPPIDTESFASQLVNVSEVHVNYSGLKP
jgi:hypothetical protein